MGSLQQGGRYLYRDFNQGEQHAANVRRPLFFNRTGCLERPRKPGVYRRQKTARPLARICRKQRHFVSHRSLEHRGQSGGGAGRFYVAHSPKRQDPFRFVVRLSTRFALRTMGLHRTGVVWLCGRPSGAHLLRICRVPLRKSICTFSRMDDGSRGAVSQKTSAGRGHRLYHPRHRAGTLHCGQCPAALRGVIHLQWRRPFAPFRGKGQILHGKTFGPPSRCVYHREPPHRP